MLGQFTTPMGTECILFRKDCMSKSTSVSPEEMVREGAQAEISNDHVPILNLGCNLGSNAAHRVDPSLDPTSQQ